MMPSPVSARNWAETSRRNGARRSGARIARGMDRRYRYCQQDAGEFDALLIPVETTPMIPIVPVARWFAGSWASFPPL